MSHPEPHAVVEVKARPLGYDPKAHPELARTFKTYHYRVGGHPITVDVGIEQTTGSLVLRCHQVQPALYVDLNDMGEELVKAMIRETVELED